MLAADTIVVDGERILGKPQDVEEARAMLLALRGRSHRVLTALALVDSDGREQLELCETMVPMRAYSLEAMAAYAASGDPLDKAGGYAIQHAGFQPVELERLAGCYASVMGLPLCHLTRAMRGWGYEPAQDVPGACQRFTGYDCPVYGPILRGER